MKKLVLAIVTAITSSSGTPSSAAETINYTYDVHGRLVQVKRTGTVNNNVTTSYSHDKADNRASKVTVGAPS